MLYQNLSDLARDVMPSSDRALEALAEGRKDRLEYWIGRMSVGPQFLFTGYLYWIVRLLTHIRDHHGERETRQALEESFQLLLAPAARLFREGREKEALLFFLALWRIRMGGMKEAAETDQGFRMLLAPCGLGGRVLLEGWYERDPSSFGRSDDGTPLFCEACRILRETFNDLAGSGILEIEPDPARPAVCRFRFQKRATAGQRFFQKEELEAAVLPSCVRALARLRAGRLEGMEDLLRDHHRHWRPLHDFLNLWVTLLESSMLRRHGVEYVYSLVSGTYIPMWQSAYGLYGSLDDRTTLRLLAYTWHYHQATFRVEEEEDRFKFVLDPCGSGGRLYRGEMGEGMPAYGSGLEKVSTPHVCTFLRSDFPVYCTHCALSNVDQFQGKPKIFVVDGRAMKEPGAPCVQYLYKKHASEKIPASLLDQVACSELIPLRKEYRPWDS